jgi:arsenical pump membrane protein
MTGAVRIGLLLLAVAGATLRPMRLAPWVVPLGCATTAVAVGAVSPAGVRHGLEPLAEPLAFLLAAVPLAVMLDRLGFFTDVAERLAGDACRPGRLWILAACVTTVLNLDAAVVLLTPLYVRIARHHDRDPLVLAFQPVLLACLASSALPVSNLTNLIAVSWCDVTTIEFVSNLGLPSLVATAVGWRRYQRVLRPDRPAAALELTATSGGVTTLPDAGGPVPDPGTSAHPRALAIGALTVVFVLVGFVAGPAAGARPWAVAVLADLALAAVLQTVPRRAIPWGTAVLAGSLGVLAAAAATHLPVGQAVGGLGTASLAGTIGATAVAANALNNLPALLVALPTVGETPGPALWAVLTGVNMGPVVLATGSLASLLWLDALARLGVAATPGDYTRVGLRVGLPAAAAGAATLLALDVVT